MNISQPRDRPIIGIALGSGASRGWSHVGVLKALLKAGIEPDVICGTSVGAMVGSSYVAGKLDALEKWVLESTRADVLAFFSIRMARTAFVDIDRFNSFLHSFVAPARKRIESLPKVFAAVCTNLDDGKEVWLKNGDLATAVRASMAMPGLFPPERHEDRWLVDGGLVNPVPVSACRALGADIVIGVNLNSDILHKPRDVKPVSTPQTLDRIFDTLKKTSPRLAESFTSGTGIAEKPPGLVFAISRSINIFQDQITRGRLAQDPADVMIAPRLADIRMFDFQRAADAIKEGEERASAALADVQLAIDSRQKRCDRPAT